MIVAAWVTCPWVRKSRTPRAAANSLITSARVRRPSRAVQPHSLSVCVCGHSRHFPLAGQSDPRVAMSLPPFSVMLVLRRVTLPRTPGWCLPTTTEGPRLCAVQSRNTGLIRGVSSVVPRTSDSALCRFQSNRAFMRAIRTNRDRNNPEPPCEELLCRRLRTGVHGFLSFIAERRR